LTYLFIWGWADLTNGDAVATAFAGMLESNTTLSELGLEATNIKVSGASALGQCLEHNNSLTSLSLDYNDIGDRGAQAFAHSLAHNTTLTTLSLSRNYIKVPGAIALAQALVHNTTLTALELDTNNGIGEGGAHALAQSMMHNTTLTTLTIDPRWDGNMKNYERSHYSIIANLTRNKSLNTPNETDSIENLNAGDLVDITAAEDDDHEDPSLENTITSTSLDEGKLE